MTHICKRKKSDRILKKLLAPSVDLAWSLTNQYIIDNLFSKLNRKFTAINILHEKHAPCCPGAVLLVKERSFKDWLLRRDKPVVFAAQLPDFYYERTLKDVRDVACLRQRKAESFYRGRYNIYFKTTDAKTKVRVEFTNLELNSVESIDSKAVRIDLDNFTHTGFHDEYFYIVKHTITTDRIRIKVTVGDDTKTFDERVVRTIGFTGDKVSLANDGSIYKSKPIKTRLPVLVMSRDPYDLLINNLLPNQTRFGGAVGDFHNPDDENFPSARLRRIQRMRQLEEDRQLIRGLYSLSIHSDDE